MRCSHVPRILVAICSSKAYQGQAREKNRDLKLETIPVEASASTAALTAGAESVILRIPI